MAEKRPQQERSKFTVSTILEAANSLLDRKGDGKITTRGIAERAGVSIGSLYQYFRGTDSILRELLQSKVLRDTDRILAEFASTAGQPVEARLQHLFRNVLTNHVETARVRVTLFHRAIGLKVVEFARDKIEKVSAELFARLKASGALRPDLNEEIAIYILSRTVLAVVMSAVLDHETMGGREDEIADELAKLASGYLTPSA